MKTKKTAKKTTNRPAEAWCIFHNCPDKAPAWHDENDMPVTHPTRKEALKEILDDCREHLRQIEDGHRDLEDGIGFDDWVEKVTLHPDGIITDMDGNHYGKRED